MARRKKPEEHVNHERWLVSYADFITLLFAFFTALYAMSTVDGKKAGALQYSTRAAFNRNFFPAAVASSPSQPMPISARSRTVDDATGRNLGSQRANGSGIDARLLAPRVAEQLAAKLNRAVARHSLSRDIVVQRRPGELRVSIGNVALFAANSDAITRRGLRALDIVGQTLSWAPVPMRIEGHADVSGGDRGAGRNLWDLSSRRAVTVVQYYIEEFAWPAHLLSATGFAGMQPMMVDSGDTTPGRRIPNRRVDVVLLTGLP